MAASGYTPILIYGSTTTGNAPSAGNLTTSASGVELAINAYDGKLFYKDAGGVVQVLATKGTGAIGGSNTQVQYNSSGSLAGSANMTFDGTKLTVAGLKDSALTSGRVTYATTSGELTDSANLTFDGTTLTANALTTTSTVTINGGTANGVAYLNGSKVLTTGSALTFDGTSLFVGATSAAAGKLVVKDTASSNTLWLVGRTSDGASSVSFRNAADSAYNARLEGVSGLLVFEVNGSEQMRLTSTGLGIGTSNPQYKFVVSNAGAAGVEIGASTGGVIQAYNRSGAAFVNLNQYALGFTFNSGASVNNTMTYDSSGNLGIGVTPSAWDGTTFKVLQAGSQGVFASEANAAHVMTNVYYNGGYKYIGTGNATDYYQYLGAHIWRTSASGSAGGTITFTQAMTLDASGNLGIGTSSPSNPLHINAAAGASVARWSDSTNGTLGFVGSASGLASGAAATSLMLRAESNLLFSGGGNAVQMTLNTSGNLGLGVTPSAWSLGKAIEVGSLGNAYFVYGNENYLTSNSYYNSGWKYGRSSVGAAQYLINANSHVWNIAASGTAGNAITFTQAMTLDASGNLGVGTTSPSYALHVQGASKSIYLNDNSSGLNLRLYNGTSSAGISGLTYPNQIISGSANALEIFTSGSSPLVFGTNATERARIDSSGNLGNTATASNFSFTTINSNATPYGVLVAYAQDPNGTGSEFFIGRGDYDGTPVNRILLRSNGGIANYQANDVNLSDRREKTNFAPAGEYLSKICAIPVQTFNYIDQNMEEDPGTTLGVVAQDVQAVAPELVMESNWGTKDEPKMRLSIYQTDLQYALMKCIQEQQAIIETLTARVAALESK